ncbi:MAG: GNAT family N-acetyltransferase, partial [Bacilli bacterium]|nr:GNAT family N-acetyltransferase [Bacilli bacterium]
PVCVIPEYRGKGVAKAMIYEALNRARFLGAKKAYVISDMEFYEKLGFKKEKHYTFYQKK